MREIGRSSSRLVSAATTRVPSLGLARATSTIARSIVPAVGEFASESLSEHGLLESINVGAASVGA